jgi:hypothetical protein
MNNKTSNSGIVISSNQSNFSNAFNVGKSQGRSVFEHEKYSSIDNLMTEPLVYETYAGRFLGVAVTVINQYKNNLDVHIGTFNKMNFHDEKVLKETKDLEFLAFSMYVLNENNLAAEFNLQVDMFANYFGINETKKEELKTKAIELNNSFFNHILDEKSETSENFKEILTAKEDAALVINALGNNYINSRLFFKENLNKVYKLCLNQTENERHAFSYAADLLSKNIPFNEEKVLGRQNLFLYARDVLKNIYSKGTLNIQK